MTRYILLLLILLPLDMASAQTLVWSTVLRDVRNRYPEVEQISVDSLAHWLQDPNRQPPLLVDVRERSEYDLSHIAGAIHSAPDSADVDDLLAAAAGRPIVLYCSVGYRSSAKAQALLQAGATSVANLEGSVFMWANEGQPVERDGKAVREVHPYNRVWGVLLNKRLRGEVGRD
ncbi:MAG: rhodanese-like domain-containing protein [Rhodothermales bacterium]|nr:rhodanese-like domain-containing protein [Rhodothermales bacterium]